MGRIYGDDVWKAYRDSVHNLYQRLEYLDEARTLRQQTLVAGARWLAVENITMLRDSVVIVHGSSGTELGRRFSDAVQQSKSGREALQKVWFHNPRLRLDEFLRDHPELLDLAEEAYQADERRYAADVLDDPRVEQMWAHFSPAKLAKLYPLDGAQHLPQHTERVQYMRGCRQLSPQQFAEQELVQWPDMRHKQIYRHVQDRIVNAFRLANETPHDESRRLALHTADTTRQYQQQMTAPTSPVLLLSPPPSPVLGQGY
jgi:hypothetical protein